MVGDPIQFNQSRRIRRRLSSPSGLIGLVLVIAGVGCFAVWQFAVGPASDFGLNAFTELLGIVITVAIIDRLLKKREAMRILPQRAAAYEDVRMLVTHVIDLWRSAFERSVPGDLPTSADELFNPVNLERIGSSLNMDSYPNVTPQRTWWDWLPDELEKHRLWAGRILERHTQILDPDAYAAVHTIATVGPDPGMLRSIRAHDQREGIPRPRVLMAYWPWDERYAESVRRLIGWLPTEYEKLRLAGHEPHFQLDIRGPQRKLQGALPSQIDPATLAQQLMEMQTWRERSKHSSNKSLQETGGPPSAHSAGDGAAAGS